LLNGIEVGAKPKQLIITISESLLDAFSNLGLIDKYDFYQHLMVYWEETMQDDAYLIGLNGWKAEISPLKNKKGKEIGWNSDLIPKTLVIDRYFSKQKDTLEVMQRQLESINQQMQTLDEENVGEEDMFSEARSEAGKITKREITQRITAIKNDPEFAEELKVLAEYQDLMDKEAELKRQIIASETELDKNLLIKYRHLTEAEIKELVIEDKWLASIHTLVDGEMERISHKLAERTKELANRYQTPLPILAEDVQALTKKVDDHLEKMGFKS
jgi:type I restriction enzyme M protein